MPIKDEKIKNPGARGGKYYINDKGKVIYGEKPKGKKGSVVDEKGGEHKRLSYNNKEPFKSQFPTHEEFNRRAIEAGLPELDAKSYKQLYQREHKEYMKGVKSEGTKNTRDGLSDQEKSFLTNRIGFDENGFYSKPFDSVNEKFKEVFNRELTKEEYMKVYKQQKYQHKKYLKEQEQNKNKEIEPSEVKSLIYNDGKFDVQAMMKLPGLKGDDFEGKSAEALRQDVFLKLYAEDKKINKFFNNEEVETIRDTVADLFTITDASVWKKFEDDISNDDFAVLWLLDDMVAEKAKVTDKWDVYERYSETFERRSEYFDYFQNGMDKVDDNRKKAQEKKKQRDIEHSTLTEKDKEIGEKIQKLASDENQYTMELGDKLREIGIKTQTDIDNDPMAGDYELLGIPMPTVYESIDKDQWKSISEFVGFEIRDSEKPYFFNSVLNPIIEANESMAKNSKALFSDSEGAIKGRKELMATINELYPSINSTLSKFYNKRVDGDGKFYNSPMEKMMYKTKREMDDKIDSKLDTSILSKTFSELEFNSNMDIVRDMLKDCNSVSEAVHKLHFESKESSKVIDELRNPFSALNSEEMTMPGEMTKKRWTEAVDKRKAIEDFQAELERQIKYSPEGKNLFPKKVDETNDNPRIRSIEQKLRKEITDNGSLSAYGELVGQSLSFVESITGNTAGLHGVLNNVTFRDQKPDSNGNVRAFARGSEINASYDYTQQSTIIHEFGHVISYNSRYCRELESEFFMERTNNTKAYKMKDLFPGVDYRDNEYAHIDTFVTPYIGKDYEKINTSQNRARMAHSSHEILSMGLQYMYENPVSFYLRDPEHYVVTMTMLRNI